MAINIVLKFCTGLAVIVLYQSALSTGQTAKCVKSSEDDCTCELSSSSKSGKVSLKSIANNDGTPRWSYQTGAGDPGSSYSYNPCYPYVQYEDCADGVAVCQVNSGFYYSLGTQKSISTSVDKNGNVVFKYSATIKDVTRNAVVTLFCEPQTKDPNFVVIGEQIPVDPKDANIDFLFEVHGEAACPEAPPPKPPSAKSSLSPGSIMCIIFFVLLVVYVVAGISYNKYRRGAEGKELVPNVEFWSDLPFLVKDGVLFAIKPCRKSSAYEKM